jgi:hypothetical protein
VRSKIEFAWALGVRCIGTFRVRAWKVRIDISWNLVDDRKFNNKAEAEQFGLEVAREWIDKHTPGGTTKD